MSAFNFKNSNGKLFDTNSAEGKQALRETNLKGKMAESLVFDLLKESGNEVYNIGIEHSLPALTHVRRELMGSKAGEKLRIIPDFFVIDSKKKAHLVEVKFRWHPKGHESDVLRLRRLALLWEEAIVVFVNCSRKPYFQFSEAPFVKEKTVLLEPICEYSHFGIKENLLDKFDELVEKYLKPTLKTPLPKDSSIIDHSAHYL